MEVSDSPSVGGAEPDDGPEISDCCLEELEGFVVGSGGAGALAWRPGVRGGGREFDLGEQFLDFLVLLRGRGCQTRVGIGQLKELEAAVCRGVGAIRWRLTLSAWRAKSLAGVVTIADAA